MATDCGHQSSRTKSIAMLRTDVELRRARLLAHMCAVEVREKKRTSQTNDENQSDHKLKKTFVRGFVVLESAAEKHAEDYMRNGKYEKSRRKYD